MTPRNPLTSAAWRAIFLAVALGLAVGWLLAWAVHPCGPCAGGHVVQFVLELEGAPQE